MNVKRLLVSGTMDQRADFHSEICMYLNAIETRNETTFYTCYPEHNDLAIEAAKKACVTVQEIHGADKSETYEMIIQGDHPGWRSHDKNG